MDELISEAKASDVARSVAVDESGATDNDSSSHAALPDMQSPSRSEAKSVDTNSADPRERSRLDRGQEALPLTVSHAFSNLDNVDLPTYVREHNATLTFPEKLMLMLMHAERLAATSGKRPDELPVGWINNGLAFVIRNKTELVGGWLPLFFRQAKFSSFTRKLYRWGFRQVNHAGETTAELPTQERASAMYFGNENFQRDNKSRLSQMRSITAAGRRREQAEQAHTSATESKEQDLYRISLEPRGVLQQSQHVPLPQPPNQYASLLQLRNTQAALASLGGMEQQQSNPLLHQPNHFIQQAVARAQLQQQQQLVAQRLLSLQPQESFHGGNPYLLQLSQLLGQSQGSPPALIQQLLALQQAQQPQQQYLPQAPVPQDTEQQQRQDQLRSLYEMLLQQILPQNQGDLSSFSQPPPPAPPQPEE